MMLYVDGSDIAHIVLGWTTPGGAVQNTTDVAVGPEGFLAAIVAFRAGARLDGIVAVTGPGSPTALRASLAIVNTLAMAEGTPLYDAHGVQHNVLLPEYGGDARVTPSSRDSLRRRV